MGKMLTLGFSLWLCLGCGVPTPSLRDLPDNSNWMKERLSKIGAKSVKSIRIPGGHDADSSQIKRFAKICPGTISVWKRVLEILGVPSAYANSQGIPATIQALAKVGIRYFDIRVCYDKGKYYGAHSLMAAPIFSDDLLGAGLEDFLKAHPKELIILGLQGDGSLIWSEDTAQTFAQQFISRFEPWMVKPPGLSPDSTLNQILAAGNLIVVWRMAGAAPSSMWPSSTLGSSWANSTDPQTVLQYELKAVSEGHTGLFVSFMDLTPNDSYIKSNLLGSLIGMEQRMNKITIDWLKNLTPKTKSLFNIIAFDAVLFDPKLVNTIISLND